MMELMKFTGDDPLHWLYTTLLALPSIDISDFNNITRRANHLPDPSRDDITGLGIRFGWINESVEMSSRYLKAVEAASGSQKICILPQPELRTQV